jgi:hypothetical protein
MDVVLVDIGYIVSVLPLRSKQSLLSDSFWF